MRQGFARRAREEGGLDVPVVLVDVGTLRRALELHDALPWAGGEPKRTQLTVLEDDPAPEAARTAMRASSATMPLPSARRGLISSSTSSG